MTVPPDNSPSLSHDREPTPELLTTAAQTLRMLAEPTRLGLLWHLAQSPRTVTELVTGTGASRTVTSQHLAKLRLSGMVDTRREGRNIIYSLHDGHLIRLIKEAINVADHQITGEPLHD